MGAREQEVHSHLFHHLPNDLWTRYINRWGDDETAGKSGQIWMGNCLLRGNKGATNPLTNHFQSLTFHEEDRGEKGVLYSFLMASLQNLFIYFLLVYFGCFICELQLWTYLCWDIPDFEVAITTRWCLSKNNVCLKRYNSLAIQ